MKLNKKGLTLIELLIAIVFIGIVLVFLFSLLTELKGESENDTYAFDNQKNKIDAIHYIQNDLNKNSLEKIRSNANGISFYFAGDNTEHSLKTIRENDKYYLVYIDSENNSNKWEMKNAILDTCGTYSFYKDSSGYYFKYHINIYNKVFNEQNNKNNNNPIDDIEITYFSNDSSIETSNLSIGNNVGNCSN